MFEKTSTIPIEREMEDGCVSAWLMVRLLNFCREVQYSTVQAKLCLSLMRQRQNQ